MGDIKYSYILRDGTIFTIPQEMFDTIEKRKSELSITKHELEQARKEIAELKEDNSKAYAACALAAEYEAGAEEMIANLKSQLARISHADDGQCARDWIKSVEGK